MKVESSASTVNSYSSRIKLRKIMNWIVVVDVDLVNAGLIVECKRFSSIDNKHQCEARSNGDLSFGVGRGIGEDEVREAEFAMGNLRVEESENE